jgi:lysine 6-dehydrogenase
MAQGAAFDYLKNPAVTSLTIADVSREALASFHKRFPDPRLRTIEADARNSEQVAALMADADGVFCAIHYGFNLEFTRLAIATKTHMVDLGGNNDVVAAQRKLSKQGQAAGVSIIPDCGLAPGMASILVAWGLKRFDWADTARIRVGGLPQNPKEPFHYERLFSVEGLINEYVEEPVMLRDGKIVTGQPLGDTELAEFDPPVGTLEAFNTSGGVSTLPESFGSRVKNLDYKTLRYPGHAGAMRWLMHLGLFDSNPVTIDGVTIVPRKLTADRILTHVPLGREDRTVVRVEFSGPGRNGRRMHRLEIVDDADPASGLSSMMRTTAFPAAIISQMQCDGRVTSRGVVPQELAVDPDMFVAEVARRGITIKGIEI